MRSSHRVAPRVSNRGGRRTVRVAATAALLLCSGIPVGLGGQADDKGRLEAERSRAGARLRALNQEADSLAAESSTLLADLRRLEAERQQKAAELVLLDRELEAARRALDKTTSELRTLEGAATAQRPMVAARLIELYKLGRAGYLRLLLNAEDLRNVSRAYRGAVELARLDRQRIQTHQRTLDALDVNRRQLAERTREIDALAEAARRARTALDQAVRAREALITSIDQRRDLNAQLASELVQAAERLDQALARPAGATTPDAGWLPLGPFRGDLDWPVPGRVTARFGRQRNPRFGTVIVRHGIEVETTEGGPVQAVHDGRVSFAAPFAGFGNVVVIDHAGGTQTVYGYLADLRVRQGDTVGRRGVVGSVGRAPDGAPRLYFELRVDGEPVDPIEWLKRSR